MLPSEAEVRNYTIPSDNRELQPVSAGMSKGTYYTIPSDNRELQRLFNWILTDRDYTIPSDNRELQLPNSSTLKISIIPYQVITGNYNVKWLG